MGKRSAIDQAKYVQDVKIINDEVAAFQAFVKKELQSWRTRIHIESKIIEKSSNWDILVDCRVSHGFGIGKIKLFKFEFSIVPAKNSSIIRLGKIMPRPQWYFKSIQPTAYQRIFPDLVPDYDYKIIIQKAQRMVDNIEESLRLKGDVEIKINSTPIRVEIVG